MGWSELVAGLMPLIGVTIGGLLTYYTQHDMENKKIKREHEKENALQEREKVKVYSQILEKDGEMVMYEYTMGDFPNFYIEDYLKEFRPLLFEKIYLLDNEIIDLIQKIDNIIKKKCLRNRIQRWRYFVRR